MIRLSTIPSIGPAHFANTNLIAWLFGSTPLDISISIILWLLIIYFGYRWIISPLLDVLGGYQLYWRARRTSHAFLEVTPPSHIETSVQATEQLIAILRRQVGWQQVASLEIVSSRTDGIRYLVGARPSDIPTIQRHLASYLPSVQFRVLDSPPKLVNAAYSGVYEVRQTRHYAYPLAPQSDLATSDPVAFITGAMTKLKPGEIAAIQLVITPYSSYWANRIHNKIMNKGYAIIDGKLRTFLLKHWWVWAVGILIGMVSHIPDFTLAWTFILLVVSMFFIHREEPPLTTGEQELYQNILTKLGQPLFRTDIRLLFASNSRTRLHSLAGGFESSLAPLSSTYQHLGLTPNYLGRTGYNFLLSKYLHCAPSVWAPGRNILSASELASLYHFPYGTITTENLVRSHSKTLPAPLSLKQATQFDITIARNHHHGTTTDIGLTTAERERHMYIIGGTGNGKTTLLQYAIIQDIQNGKGVAVIDPHGDMAELLLRYIPKERINDVIYFNPDELAHPIGLNLLELTPGLTGDELLREKDLVTESVVSIFRKIFSEDDSGGHRIEYVLRTVVQTALTVEGATLFTVYRLLNDPKYRSSVVKTLENEDLKNFWDNELGKAGGFQQVKMVAGITAKIGRFLFSASAKRILEQPKSTINFDEILDGKILICNFSKGLLGEDTSELFGTSILAKIQMAALRRARTTQANRKPFYLYVDEFQNFATPSFVQMLSEARKYRLFLTMAEQSTSQQDDLQTVNIILANVGAVITFRSGNPEDEKLVLPLFQPYVEEGEIANLPAYNFYMRISSLKTQEPFSGETIVLEGRGSEAMAEKAIEVSQANYAKEYVTPKPKTKPISTKGSKKTKNADSDTKSGRPDDL